VVLAAVQNEFSALQFASEELKNNKDIVLAAVGKDARAFWYASENMRNSKAVVMVAVQKQPEAPFFASDKFNYDKDVVLAAVQNDGLLLRDASPRLQNDKEVVMAAIENQPAALEFASDELKNDAGVVFAAVQKDFRLLQYASEKVRNNKTVLLAAVQNEFWTLDTFAVASDALENDADVVLAAVQKDFRALQYASEKIRNSKKVIMAAAQNQPAALQYASEKLLSDKEIAIAAVGKDPDAIKYFDESIKNDPEILIASGMFDANHESSTLRLNITTHALVKKIVLSTRFSLHSQSTSEATRFTKLLKENDYIKESNFKIYAPNAFDKKTCDPSWTDFDHPCRGTDDTCQYNNILTKTGQATDDCCWRYSFRRQLEEARVTRGFMLQLVECESSEQILFPELGKGQQIERHMAKQVGVKIFHVHRPVCMDSESIPSPSLEHFEAGFDESSIEEVASAIKCWYAQGCSSLDAIDVVRPVTTCEVFDY